jgi:hypothetical protein
VTGGGILTVTNLGPDLQPGDMFQLFNQPVGGFASVSLPQLGPDYGWANNLANNGTLAVVSTVPVNLVAQMTGGNLLTLAWPTDHSGWQLQVQTNSPGEGLSTNWRDVAGSTMTNLMTLPINTTDGSIFYRLSYLVSP